jgi:hypothetical protein
VLLGGQGGSGKTTTSIAAGIGGLEFLGDDHVGLEQLDDGSFTGHSLYNCTRLAPDNVGRFPQLMNRALDYFGLGEEKHLIFLAECEGARLRRSAPVTALALPRLLGSDRTTYVEAGKGEAMLKLAPSSVTMPFRTGHTGFARLADLVRAVPCYWFDLGPDVSDVPEALGALLRESTVEAAAR